MKIKHVLLAMCVIVVMLLVHCSQELNCESMTPKITWEKWDNYAKDNSHKREYWGQWDPEGGWQGNPYAPNNNPGGYGFAAVTSGQALPGGGGQQYQQYQQYQRPSNPYVATPARQARPEINFANASKEELAYMYKSGIMA